MKLPNELIYDIIKYFSEEVRLKILFPYLTVTDPDVWYDAAKNDYLEVMQYLFTNKIYCIIYNMKPSGSPYNCSRFDEFKLILKHEYKPIYFSSYAQLSLDTSMKYNSINVYKYLSDKLDNANLFKKMGFAIYK